MSTAGAGGGGPMQQPTTWSAVAEGYAEETKDLKVFAEAALGLAQLGQNARVLDLALEAGGFDAAFCWFGFMFEAVQKRVPADGPFELTAEAILTCGTR